MRVEVSTISNRGGWEICSTIWGFQMGVAELVPLSKCTMFNPDLAKFLDESGWMCVLTSSL
jgi:hypothetical protein